MQMEKIIQDGQAAVLLFSDEVLLTDGQTALDLMMTVQYETNSSRIALNKEAITADFFDLRCGLAGEILQKFSNYRMKLAIYGDFSAYTSQALRDFMRECNQGQTVFFTADRQEALQRLLNASS